MFDAVNSVLELLIRILVVKLKHKTCDQLHFFRAMTWNFWPFGARNEADKIKIEDLANLWIRKYEATWREALQEGDEIDVKYKDEEVEGWR